MGPLWPSATEGTVAAASATFWSALESALKTRRVACVSSVPSPWAKPRMFRKTCVFPSYTSCISRFLPWNLSLNISKLSFCEILEQIGQNLDKLCTIKCWRDSAIFDQNVAHSWQTNYTFCEPNLNWKKKKKR